MNHAQFHPHLIRTDIMHDGISLISGLMLENNFHLINHSFKIAQFQDCY